MDGQSGTVAGRQKEDYPEQVRKNSWKIFHEDGTVHCLIRALASKRQRKFTEKKGKNHSKISIPVLAATRCPAHHTTLSSSSSSSFSSPIQSRCYIIFPPFLSFFLADRRRRGCFTRRRRRRRRKARWATTEKEMGSGEKMGSEAEGGKPLFGVGVDHLGSGASALGSHATNFIPISGETDPERRGGRSTLHFSTK